MEYMDKVFNTAYKSVTSPNGFKPVAKKIVKGNPYLRANLAKITSLKSSGEQALEDLRESVSNLLRLPDVEKVRPVCISDAGTINALLGHTDSVKVLRKGIPNIKQTQVILHANQIILNYTVEDLYDENKDIFGEILKNCEIMENAKRESTKLLAEVNTDLKYALQETVKDYEIEIIDKCPWYVYWFAPLSQERKRAKKIRPRSCKFAIAGAALYTYPVSAFDYKSKFNKFGAAILKATKKHEKPEPGDTTPEVKDDQTPKTTSQSEQQS